MKRILITILILTISVAAIAAPGKRRAAGAPGAPQERGGGEFLSPAALAEFLGLSETQQEQAKAIRERLRTTVEPLGHQMKGYYEQIEAAVDAGNAQQAGELLLAARAVRTQIQTAREAADADFTALLTSEQKAKWEIYRQILQLKHNRGARD